MDLRCPLVEALGAGQARHEGKKPLPCHTDCAWSAGSSCCSWDRRPRQVLYKHIRSLLDMSGLQVRLSPISAQEVRGLGTQSFRPGRAASGALKAGQVATRRDEVHVARRGRCRPLRLGLVVQFCPKDLWDEAIFSHYPSVTKQ